jgi:hypothetical protein
VIRPVLISLAVIAGIGAAFLWRTAVIDPAPVAKQKDSPIEVGLSPATPVVEIESAVPSGQSISTPGERIQQAALRQFIALQVRDDPDSLARYRKELEREYENAGKALALTPEEVNRIIDTLIRLKQESDAALRGLASRDPADVSLESYTTEMLRLQRSARQRQDVEMMALLGNKYTQWQEFNLAPVTRTSVNDLQTLMEMSDVRRLTPEQADSLAAALNSERVRILRDTNADQKISPGADFATGVRQAIEWEQRHTPESNRRLEVVASRLLDPQQLAIYSRMLEDAYNKRVGELQRSIAELKAAESALRGRP